jgi:hypothetical protein
MVGGDTEGCFHQWVVGWIIRKEGHISPEAKCDS